MVPHVLNVCPASSQLMQQLYDECTLVHADLSEYNMLWHAGKVRSILFMFRLSDLM